MFNEFSFPKGLNLNLLSSVVSERKMLKLILDNCSKDRKARRIILPSKTTIKKVICHHYGRKVANGELTWPQAMKELGRGFASLKEAGLERKQVRRLYLQREREIEKEWKNDRR